jgi:hypothetical protein
VTAPQFAGQLTLTGHSTQNRCQARIWFRINHGHGRESYSVSPSSHFPILNQPKTGECCNQVIALKILSTVNE